MNAVKEETKKLLDNLPDDITWDDLMYELYVRSQVEEALQQEKEGKVLSHDEVERLILAE